MIPGSFDYLAAHSVNEAVALLDQHGEDAKVLAGGQSLIPLLRFRLASPVILIDINQVRHDQACRYQKNHNDRGHDPKFAHWRLSSAAYHSKQHT